MDRTWSYLRPVGHFGSLHRATVTLADLYKPKLLGRCESQSPWLTPRRMTEEACVDDLRLLPRSATNTYFPQTVTVISLTKADDRVRQTIAENKSTIDSIRALPNFLDVLRLFPQTKEAFKAFSDDEIVRALAKESLEAAPANVNPRIAEFDLLTTGAPFIGADKAGSFFYAETLPREGLGLQSRGTRSSKMWSRCIGCAK